MMVLNEQQISILMRMISGTRPDCLDCDGCFLRIAEFAEAQLKDLPISDAMKEVSSHLKQCACCHAEYQVLLEALTALKEQMDLEGDSTGDSDPGDT